MIKPKYASSHIAGDKVPVVIDGCRTAFVKSFGAFEDSDTLELYSRCVSGLLKKVGIDPNEIDEISSGVVIPQTKNPNVARDTALNTSLPSHIHGSTTNRACASSLQTIADAAKTVAFGSPSLTLAGGVEVLSDVPIVYSKKARSFLVKFSKTKNTASKLSLLSQFSAKSWLPTPPSLSEPLTGLTMGQHAEIMAKINQISRADQDAFTLLSHQRAFKAQEAGYLDEEIIPVWAKSQYKDCVDKDNIIRPETTLEKLSQLRSVFDKKHGTISAGNSSALTDGAAVCLIADQKRAFSLGLKPKAKIVDVCWVGVDPSEQLLIGPAIAIPMLLKKNNLKTSDIDRFEIHEAFAAQVLSCLRSMESPAFSEKYFGDSTPYVGTIPEDRLNVNGGALAIGHPFGATGARLVTTLSNELIRSDKQFGVISICAAGGMAGAMLIERCNS